MKKTTRLLELLKDSGFHLEDTKEIVYGCDCLAEIDHVKATLQSFIDWNYDMDNESATAGYAEIAETFEEALNIVCNPDDYPRKESK